MKDFESIIDDYHPIIFKISRSYTDNEDDFQDLYQEIRIQIWNSLSRFQGRSQLSTFIYRVALNTSMVFVRNEKRRRKKVEQAINEYDQTPESVPDTEPLFRAIRLLNKDDRSLIILHLEEKSYQEIAEILGITKSNVGVKLTRIKKKLYTIIKEESDDGNK